MTGMCANACECLQIHKSMYSYVCMLLYGCVSECVRLNSKCGGLRLGMCANACGRVCLFGSVCKYIGVCIAVCMLLYMYVLMHATV